MAGVYAYYDAVKELYSSRVKVDHLFVACGTGTTLTGICAGMQKYYPQAIVHAISTARTRETELPVLLDDMQLLNYYLGTNYSFSNLDFSDNYLCGGYGEYNDELMLIVRECISKEGMIIDPTYSGKAFYGMAKELSRGECANGSNILFWNTGGIFNLLSLK